MRRDPDGVYRAWNRSGAQGVPLGAQTFATAREAARFCWQQEHNQP